LFEGVLSLNKLHIRGPLISPGPALVPYPLPPKQGLDRIHKKMAKSKISVDNSLKLRDALRPIPYKEAYRPLSPCAFSAIWNKWGAYLKGETVITGEVECLNKDREQFAKALEFADLW
jgi:hypothetical protein